MGTPMTYISGNTGTYQSGTFNKGTIALNLNPSSLASGNNWYNGVDVTATQYLIYSDTYSQGQATVANSKPTAWTTPDLSDTSLLNLINTLPDRVGLLPFTSLPLALQWINATNKYFLIKTNFENIVTSGLVLNLDAGWYNSYSGTTTWFDKSGNGNNGTLVNSPTFNGSSQGAIVFDGGDDYISFNNISPISSLTFTISSVVTIDTDTVQYMRVVSKGHYGFTPGYLLQRFGDSSVATGIRFSLGIGSSTSNASTSLFAYTTDTFQKGQKYYLTMVSTGTYLYLYVNGVRVGLTKYSGTGGSIENGTDLNYSAISGSLSITTSDKFTIGAYSNTSSPVGEYWNGKISNTLIYNTALSPEQVLQNYNAQKSRFGIYDIVQSGLTFNYSASNYLSYPRSGTTWYDMSSNYNNGTLTNGPTFKTTSTPSIQFDGSDDYVQTDYSGIVGTNPRTLSIWFKPDISQNKNLLGYGTNSNHTLWDILLYNGDVGVHLYNSSAEANTPYTVGVWQNITFTFTYPTIKSYMNGVYKNSYTSNLINTGSFIKLNLCKGAYFEYNFFDGEMSDVHIYNRELSPQEIVQNYEARRTTYGATGYTTSGLTLNLDAGNYASYPTTGTKWVDISGNYNNGDLINGPTWSSLSGGTITFDGIDDRVTISNESNFDFTNAIFTLETWFKCNNTTNDSQILINKSRYGTNGRMFELYLTSSLGIRFGSFYGNWTYLTYGSTINTNQWYHLIVTSNGSSATMYLNGVSSVTSNSMNSTLANIADPVDIGGYTGGSSLSGNIAVARIYNRALSATEVSQNYNALKGRFGL